MAGNDIKFGTSGWRALIADEFTFANVRRVTAAIAGHAVSRNPKPTLIVGHDTRFFSEEFARTAAGVLHSHGIRVLLCDGPTPTPVIACEILRRKTDGAINFTASHNPADYHGLKFSGADAGPAKPEVTRDIEARAAGLSRSAAEAEGHDGDSRFELIDPHEAYFHRLSELVRFAAMREAGLKLVCDPLYGAGAGYLDGVFAANGIAVESIRTKRDVLFGGHGPDVSEENLAVLGKTVVEHGAQIGLATDGDADRFGIVDSDGSFVQPNHVLALLYDYLVETRGWKMDATRSVATSHLLDAVARHHGQRVHEVPVGFKNIAPYVIADQIALGGEESAGLTIRGHVPEKDGILACLLVAEMCATRRAPVLEQLQALFTCVGAEFWPLRVNLHLSDEVKARLLERLKEDYSSFAGRCVAATNRMDGLKLVFENGSWLLMRLSGTEPIVRLYVEAQSPEASRALADSAQQWIFE